MISYRRNIHPPALLSGDTGGAAKAPDAQQCVNVERAAASAEHCATNPANPGFYLKRRFPTSRMTLIAELQVIKTPGQCWRDSLRRYAQGRGL